jgi:hypothetical protein
MNFYANAALIGEFSDAVSLEEILQTDSSEHPIINDHHRYFIARDVRITRSSSIV